MFALFRLLLAALVASGLVAQPLVAYAQAVSPIIPPSVSYGLRSATLTPGTLNTIGSAVTRDWAANMVSGAVTVTDSMAVRIAANDVAMTASRTIPWVGIARAAARALPYVAAGALIYELYENYHCRALSGSDTSLGCATGQPEQSVVCWGHNLYPTGSTCDLQKLCNEAAASQAPGYTGGNPGATHGTITPFDAYHNYQCQMFAANYVGGTQAFGVQYLQAVQVTDTTCGTGRSKGKGVITEDPCFKIDRAADPVTAVPVNTVADKVVYAPGTSPNPADLAKAVASKGVDLAPAANPVAITGPANVLGPVSTTTTHPTTGPDIVSSTQPQYDFTYPAPGQNTVTYTEKTVTANPDGSTTTATKADPPTAECGITGKPDCNVKVNETGTKTAADVAAAEAALAAAKTDITGAIADTNSSGKQSTLPTNWGWTVPVGSCSAFQFDTGRLGAFSIDPCSSSGVAAWRTLLAWYLGALTLLYIWRSGTELKGG